MVRIPTAVKRHCSLSFFHPAFDRRVCSFCTDVLFKKKNHISCLDVKKKKSSHTRAGVAALAAYTWCAAGLQRRREERRRQITGKSRTVHRSRYWRFTIRPNDAFLLFFFSFSFIMCSRTRRSSARFLILFQIYLCVFERNNKERRSITVGTIMKSSLSPSGGCRRRFVPT